MPEEKEVKLLKCAKCKGFLIRVNEIKEGQRVDCVWMCISPECRIGLEFPKYYGYTQKDINNQVEK